MSKDRDSYAAEKDAALVKKYNAEMDAAERAAKGEVKMKTTKNTKVKVAAKVVVQKSNESYVASNPTFHIGEQARKDIMAGISFQECYETIHKAVPHSQFGKNSWNWYKQQLRNRGYDVPKSSRAVVTAFPDLRKKEIKEIESKRATK